MVQDLGSPDDEQLYLLLRRYDEAVSQGAVPSPLESELASLNPAGLDELEDLCECVSQLETLRRDQRRQPNADTVRTGGPIQPLACEDGAPRIGRFELRGEIGRGGCGIVFRSYDAALEREVAIKIPRPEALISRDLRERFLREARAAGHLDHPNVVPIFEVGEDGAVCYIAAAYIEGPSLATWLGARQKAVDMRQAATLVAELSDAVEQAHVRGVIHRDIKPGNILLQQRRAGTSSADLADYTPKLTDFGLAKLYESSETTTRTGMVIGTPAYMAPEQARGRLDEIGPATDVYALGAILYELLAGQPPLRGETDADTLRRIVSDTPPLVRLARPGVARDIEAIALKCLEKRPAHRYSSAAALAADLQRFLNGQTTQARPIGPARRLLRWSQRRPAVAALLLVCALFLTIATAGAWLYNARLSEALSTAEAERTRAEQESYTSRKLLYSADVRLAYDAWNSVNRARTIDLLARHIPASGETDLREFAWHWLWGQCHAEVRTFAGHADEVFGVAFSPDGQSLATCSKDGTVRIWNAATGDCRHVLSNHTDEVTCLAFSPDGTVLATGSEDHRVILWNPLTGEPLTMLEAHEDHILAVAFSRDGRQLASGGRDNCVRVWNLATQEQITVLNEPQTPVRGIQYSPNGQLLAACDESGVIHSWETRDWQAEPPCSASKGPLFALDFAADSEHLIAAGRDAALFYWNLVPRKHVKYTALEQHESWIRDASLAPGGQIAATCNQNGFVRLWDITKRAEPGGQALVGVIPGHVGRIWGLDWSPDGRQLATAGADHAVKLWDVADYVLPAPYENLEGWIWDAVFVQDTGALMTRSRSGRIATWDVEQREVVSSFELKQNDWSRASVAVSPDGRYFACSTWGDSHVRVFDLQTQQMLFERGGYAEGILDLDISPDGKRLAIGAEGGAFAILAIPSGALYRQVPQPSGVNSVRFSPDGRYLLTGCRNLTLWDVERGNVQWSQRYGEFDPRNPVFSPTTPIIAVGDGDDRIVLVAMTTGEILNSLVRDNEGDWYLAFSPDGATLAAGSEQSSMVSLWDTRTMQELCVLEASLQGLFAIAFSPDGKRLIAAGQHAELRPTKHGTGRIVEWEIRSQPQTKSVR